VKTRTAKLKRVTQRPADEDQHATPRDPAGIAVYRNALAEYTAVRAGAVTKVKTVAARQPAMTVPRFYQREDKPARQADLEEQTFATAATAIA